MWRKSVRQIVKQSKNRTDKSNLAMGLEVMNVRGWEINLIRNY